MSKFYGHTVTIYNKASESFVSTNTDKGWVQQQKTAKTWEHITVFCVAPDTVAFRSWNGKYITMKNNFGLGLVDAIHNWEHFKIIPYGGPDPDRYYIHSPKWLKTWKFEDGTAIYGRDVPPTGEEEFTAVYINIVDP